LANAIASEFPWLIDGRIGGRMLAGCLTRFRREAGKSRKYDASLLQNLTLSVKSRFLLSNDDVSVQSIDRSPLPVFVAAGCGCFAARRRVAGVFGDGQNN
jgi:hypothetical protein